MFYSWSDNKGELENSFTRDEVLTNLTIYWCTGTVNSAMRIYYEMQKNLHWSLKARQHQEFRFERHLGKP